MKPSEMEKDGMILYWLLLMMSMEVSMIMFHHHKKVIIIYIIFFVNKIIFLIDIPSPDDIDNAFGFPKNRLGIRVPFLMISPLIEKGY